MLFIRVWVALSFGLLQIGHHAVNGDCGAVPVIDNTNNNASGDPFYPTDTVVKYECNDGYTRSGYKYVKCLSNGTWWQHIYPITCNPKSCGDPGTPRNGEKDTYVYTVGSVVRYTCNEGYELNGYANRECRIDAQWSRSTPTCDIVTCAALPDPANGQISLSSNEREYQSVASLDCNEGFDKGQTTNRICQADKTWSGEDFVCEEIVCGPHPPVPNAEVEAQGANKWGDSVHVRCFPNATSSTPHLDYNVIHCTDDGTWGPDPQDCWAGCTIPKDFLGEIKKADTNGEIAGGSTVPHSTKVIYSCPENSVIWPSMASSREVTCTNGVLAKHPGCISAPCDLTSISKLGSDPVEPSCLLETGKDRYLKHNCSITVTCADEGERHTFSCIYGRVEGKPCPQVEGNGFPPWAIVLILLGIGGVVGAVVGLVCYKKKLN